MSAGNREVKAKSWTTTAILTLVEPLIRRLIRRALNGAGIGGDAIDHGALDGLSDDDHAQYLLDVAGTGGVGIDVISRVISVVLNEIDHDLLLNFLSNEHIDWTAAIEDFSTSGIAAIGNLTITGDITVSGTVDGRDISADGTRLDLLRDNSMMAPIGLSIANLTDVTVTAETVSYFLYLGRVIDVPTTANFLTRVTTSISGGKTPSWAEVGVFIGDPPSNNNAFLTRVGFTSVASIFSSTGIKNVTISLSGVQVGNGIWLAWGNQAGFGGIRFNLRAMLADDIRSGVFQTFAGRISLMSLAGETTILASATEKPAWARLKI